MTWDKIVKAVAAIIGAGIGCITKQWTPLLTALAVIMGADYISGMIVAACRKSPNTEGGGLSSKVGFIGLAKKAFILILILMATVLDEVIGTGTSVFQSSLALYYIANEGLSVLENAALLDVPFPAKLRGALEEIKSDSRKDSDADR